MSKFEETKLAYKTPHEKPYSFAEKTQEKLEGFNVFNVVQALELVKKYYSNKPETKESARDIVKLISRAKLLSNIPENEIVDQLDKLLTPYRQLFRDLILNLDIKNDVNLIKKVAILVGENEVMSGFYTFYGDSYKNTDCVEILRQNKTFSSLMKKNPIRYLSDGADLVYNESFGKVVDRVDRNDFARLNKYKPNKDKVYIFCLVKEPLMFMGKPNITHIQIPTNLNNAENSLVTLHASSDQQKVAIEQNFQGYMKSNKFERVFVIEVDLKNPNYNDPFKRELRVEATNYNGSKYQRPPLASIPLVPKNNFRLIPEKAEGPWNKIKSKINGRNEDVQIYPEEISTLNLLSNNQELKLLTLVTGIREGKIGNWKNYKESLAQGVFSDFNAILDTKGTGSFFDPDGHSLGEHQISNRSGVPKLFNEWLDKLSEKKAAEFGYPVDLLWKKKERGEAIKWADLTKHLASYDFSTKTHQEKKISTICAYLILEHLGDVQLKNAYKAYSQPYLGLEEQPENIIAVGASYRSGMNVMIYGAQQYRMAEVAFSLGLIDKNFEFTESILKSPEYAEFSKRLGSKQMKNRGVLTSELVCDGYKGEQLPFLMYMIYKTARPSDAKFQFQNFVDATSSTKNLITMECPPSDNSISVTTCGVVKLMRQIYMDRLGHHPNLLMTEAELRSNGTVLNNKKIKFANEGLWAESHFQKYSYENWKYVEDHRKDGSDGEAVDKFYKNRTIQTCEASKLSPIKAREFQVFISRMPDQFYFKKYPAALLTIAFNRGLFGKDKLSKSFPDFEKTLQDLFYNHLGKLQKETGLLSENALMQIAPLVDLLNFKGKNGPHVVACILNKGVIYENDFSRTAADSVYWKTRTTYFEFGKDGLKNFISQKIDPENFLSNLSDLLRMTDAYYQNPLPVTNKPVTGNSPYSLEKLDLDATLRASIYPQTFEELGGRFEIYSEKKLRAKPEKELTEKDKQELFVLNLIDEAKETAVKYKMSVNFAYVIMSVAALETGWGQSKNEWGDATLAKAAKNFFSLKNNFSQYSKEDFDGQKSENSESYYIHHTKEYISPGDILGKYPDGTVKKFVFSGKPCEVNQVNGKYYLSWPNGKTIEFKQGEKDKAIYFECYEAFRKYPTFGDSMSDFVGLISKRYPKTAIAATKEDFSIENITGILQAMTTENYATDPKYWTIGSSIAGSIIKIAKKYGKEA